jgi:hypothetical protein
MTRCRPRFNSYKQLNTCGPCIYRWSRRYAGGVLGCLVVFCILRRDGPMVSPFEVATGTLFGLSALSLAVLALVALGCLLWTDRYVRLMRGQVSLPDERCEVLCMHHRTLWYARRADKCSTVAYRLVVVMVGDYRG